MSLKRALAVWIREINRRYLLKKRFRNLDDLVLSEGAVIEGEDRAGVAMTDCPGPEAKHHRRVVCPRKSIEHSLPGLADKVDQGFWSVAQG